MCRRRNSVKRKRSLPHSERPANAPRLPHLDSCVLENVFRHCQGTARVQFGAVCKAWRAVRQKCAVRIVPGEEQLQATLEVRFTAWHLQDCITSVYAASQGHLWHTSADHPSPFSQSAERRWDHGTECSRQCFAAIDRASDTHADVIVAACAGSRAL